MIYDKAIIFQPKETNHHYWPKLTLELFVDKRLVKSIREKYKCQFVITDSAIIIYDTLPCGHDEGIRRSEDVIYRIPMSEIKEFQNIDEL